MRRSAQAQRSRRSGLGTGWHAHLPHGPAVEPYYDWLVHVGSLTERLRRRCSGFRVVVLRQELARPGADERGVLHLARRDLAWVRDVLLLCGGRPVVFAHSVLPRSGLRGGWHLFAGLGARPLGAILFTDPLVRRMPFAFRRLDPRHPLYHRAAEAAGAPAGGYWARRSAFLRRGKPVLVTEVFLPEILALQP
jgi:chorismate--pyruvate lyase